MKSGLVVALVLALASTASAQQKMERVDGQQAAGPTVFEPFPDGTRYFGRAEQAFMLNFRVRDLDAMVAQLRRADITVDVDAQAYPNGRFARLSDPEGNPIQLWQPKRSN